MKHDISVSGFGVRLRPVRLDDAAFLVWLRGSDFVRSRLGDSAPDIVSQEGWLHSYFERAGDYYFIVETLNGVPLGTHAIYDIHEHSGEIGRNVIRPEALSSVPAALLATDLAFEGLGLTELRTATLATNVKVRSMIRKAGYQQVGVTPNFRVVGGQPVDLLQFALTFPVWASVRPSIVPLASLASTHLEEWATTQLDCLQPWELSELPTENTSQGAEKL